MRKLIDRVRVTRKQREKLHKILRSHKSEQRMVLRAKIITLLSERNDETAVARELKVNIKTVRKWRNRFHAKGVEGLKDLTRSGAPAKFTVVERCEVIAIACDHPKNYGYETYNCWTGEILTKVVNNEIEGLNMSQSSVLRTLEMNELKPHKFKMWLHSKDTEFKEKVLEDLKRTTFWFVLIISFMTRLPVLQMIISMKILSVLLRLTYN